MTTRGKSYTDPLYDRIEAGLEQKYGLPSGGIRAIRTRGERSNADQVSSVGARTVYQIMPQTRALFKKTYGVDAYSGPEGAAEVAALHLRDSMKRNGGSWEAAVGEYHGGPDRAKWGPVNRAYRQRVAGQATNAAPGAASVGPVGTPIPDVPVPTVDDLLFGTPDPLYSQALQERARARLPKAPKLADLVRQGMDAQYGTPNSPNVDTTAVNSTAADARAGEVAQAEKESFGHWDRFKAGMSETLVGQMVQHYGDKDPEFDPKFMSYYKTNWRDIESFAKTDDEVDQLREATSAEHLQTIRSQIEEDRQRETVINSSDMGWAVRLGTGVLDPVGWAAGLGVGKAAQLTGVGARAAWAAGNYGRAAAYSALEGAAGNLAVTAGLDAVGDYVSPAEYKMSTLTGLAIGAAMTPLHWGAQPEAPRVAGEAPTGGYHTAWQGSPSEPFDAHQWDKLGSGEGNHAQGKGHYTAENQAIGAWYWDQLTKGGDNMGSADEGATRDLLTGIRINPAEFVGFPEADAIKEAQGIFGKVSKLAQAGKDKALTWLKEQAEWAMGKLSNQSGVTGWELGRMKYRAAVSKNLHDELEPVIRAEKGGSVYKVRIRKGDYLDWDTPLAQQPESIRAKVRKAGYQGADDATGEQVYRSLSDDADAASAALRDAGILGNQYLNALARSGKAAPEGNRNFVTFSDDAISIEQHWTPSGGWVKRDKVMAWDAEDDLGKLVGTMQHAQRQYQQAVREEVEADLGPNASPEEVAQAVDAKVGAEYQAAMRVALSEVPAEQRLLVAGDTLTDHPEVRAAMEAGHDLAKVADATDRAMVAEMAARAEAIVGGTDIKDVRTILEQAPGGTRGLESTALTLIKSDSPVAKAVALTLLENPTGAGGRRRTAAISMATRERLYNEHFAEWDKLMQQYRRQEGMSRMGDFWDGRARNKFNDAVFSEVEARGQADYLPHENPIVRQAADLFEAGMDKMRLEQQHVRTVGAARLGNDSRGYVQHRLDPRAVLKLSGNHTQSRRVREILKAQFQEHEGWDADFSEGMAAKYLERAREAAKGRHQVPFNVSSPEGSQIVRDILDGMNLPHEELDRILGKFSRGGAAHTKKRIRLDLSADIGDGMQLKDLFVRDMPTLYRSYARRVAGEVALAQYGIMGKKGLDVLAKALDATGAGPKEMEAFEQIAAEFLNTPYGNYNHVWMDNLRVATSAARLGGMGFTQFAEWGNAIPALGVRAAMNGVASMPRLMSEVRAIAKGAKTPNPILQSIDTMGGHLGMEDYNLTRMFDVRDNDIEIYGSEGMGVGTRMIRAGSHGVMIASGHRMMVAVQTRAMAEQIIRKAVKFAKAGDADTALEDMGITASLRAAMREDMDNIATFNAKGELESLDLLKAKALKPHQVAELTQAIERGAGQIIQRTFTGETGKWAHNGFLKLLFQFRTFSLVSVEKQWGRNVHNYGAMKSFVYLAATASFAVPIYLSRLQANMLAMPEEKREDYWEQNAKPLMIARAVMNYASASGLSGDILDLGAGFASQWGGDWGERFLNEHYDVRGKRSDQFIGGVVAPGAGLVQDTWGAIMNRSPKQLARSLPGGNLPYVSPFLSPAAAELDALVND